MKLLRYGPAGQEKPGLLDSDGAIRDLSGVIPDLAGEALSPAVLAKIASIDPASLPKVEGNPRLGPPVAGMKNLVCIGLNYADHAAETGAPIPKEPIVFLKSLNALSGPNDDVVIPRNSVKTDWEVELAVVIGRRARYLHSPEEAAAHIAGYTISNDVSERAFQLEISGGQWSKGKCAETFNPLGPALVPADELDVSDVRLTSSVNGEPRQDSTTADLIFSVPYLVWHLSQVAVLEPGDVINTGTPQGVAISGRFPYLRAGDVVELAIEGIGTQRQVLAQA